MDGVSVGRLTVDCAVPRDHPDPPAVRRRLEDAAERLSIALAELLAPLAKLGDEVIVIRRLELACDLDTSLPPSELARVWAARIAAAVAAHLRPEARASMLRFSDEARYLARFLVDTIGGHAQQTWYYRRWRGFALLSAAAQLRSALVEDPDRGLSALAALSPSELMAVLAALGPREARRVAGAVIAGRDLGGSDREAVAAMPESLDGGADLERATRVLAPLVPVWLPVASASPSAWQAGLALAVRAVAACSPTEARAAVALAVAIAAVASEPALRWGATPPAAAMLDGAGLPTLAPLLALSAVARSELLAPLGAGAAAPAPTPATWYTRLGGLLLLLPRIAELPLDELCGDEAGAARLLVLARAAGIERRDQVVRDPLWRQLCGVAPDADLDAWPHDAAIADRLAVAMWQRGLARAERLRAIATRGDHPLLVIAGEPGGDWLALTELTPALRAVLRRSGPIAIAGIDLSASIALASAHAAARMIEWLSPDLSSPIDRALALAAQHVLRAFARRLPGFAESSPRFLYDSFLDFDATVLERDGTFHCRVGRPRLAALFGLTGALRGRLPIGDGRALELYPA